MMAQVKEWWKLHSTAILVAVIAMAKAGSLGKWAASVALALAGLTGISYS
jgi:hypothetical protein